jgi:hypothetical protein
VIVPLSGVSSASGTLQSNIDPAYYISSTVSNGRDGYISKVKFRAAAICPKKAGGFNAFDEDDSCVASIDIRLRWSVSSFNMFEYGSLNFDGIMGAGAPFLWTGRLSATKWTEIELDVSQIYWYLINRNYLFTFLAETINLSPIFGLQFSYGAWSDDNSLYCSLNANGSPCTATAVLIQTTGPIGCPGQNLVNASFDDVDWRRARPDESEASRSIHVFLGDCGSCYECSGSGRRLDGSPSDLSFSVDPYSVVTQIEYRTN